MIQQAIEATNNFNLLSAIFDIVVIVVVAIVFYHLGHANGVIDVIRHNQSIGKDPEPPKTDPYLKK